MPAHTITLPSGATLQLRNAKQFAVVADLPRRTFVHLRTNDHTKAVAAGRMFGDCGYIVECGIVVRA